jgi:hypothetical protein
VDFQALGQRILLVKPDHSPGKRHIRDGGHQLDHVRTASAYALIPKV